MDNSDSDNETQPILGSDHGGDDKWARRKSTYKSVKKPETTEERREKHSEELREKRKLLVDERRKIALDEKELENQEDQSKSEKTEPAGEKELENQEAQSKSKKIEPIDNEIDDEFRKYLNKMNKFRIMAGLWMRRVPEMMDKNWVAKICPKGQRRLVVAKKEHTVAYNKYGRITDKFLSALPGGNRYRRESIYTVLDCIYCHSSKIYYVLDMLAWNNINYIDCQTDCRFAFLRLKLLNYEPVKYLHKGNHRLFLLLPHMNADRESLTNALSAPYVISAKEQPIDGVLFFNKSVTYQRDITDQVQFLKVFMIPEVLNITVNEIHMKKPEEYANFQKFIDNWDKLTKENYIREKEKKKRTPAQKAKERLDGNLHILQSSCSFGCCRVCLSQKKKGDRSTNFFCQTCTALPFLHVGECFERYHTVLRYGRPYESTLAKLEALNIEVCKPWRKEWL